MLDYDMNDTWPEVFHSKDKWEIRKDRSGPRCMSYILFSPERVRIAFVHTHPDKLAVAMGYSGPMPVYEYEPE